MSTELKPCPFCGARPHLTVRPDNAEATTYFAAVGCYCGGYSACAHKMATAPEADKAEALACAAWNRRALSAQPPADADALTEATARYTLPTSIAAFVEGAEWALQPTAPSVPPVRERLTETQIDSASPVRIESAHWFKLGARWAERALSGGEG